MNKTLIAGVVLLAVILVAGTSYVFTMPETVVADLVIEGDYAPSNLELTGGATLTVQGDLTVDRTISCKDGPLSITVKGSTTIRGDLRCEGGGDVTLVAEGGLMMSESAEVTSDGNVQFVSDASLLLTTEEDINAKFNEIGRDSGTGQRVGPLISDGESVSVLSDEMPQGTFASAGAFFSALVPTAHAQALVPVVISGTMNVGTPPKGVKRLVIFAFPEAEAVSIADFQLTGPNGRDGDDDVGKSCDAEGAKGEDAFRFNAVAPNLTVNNFTLTLGSGGMGGDAETTAECDPGRAEGGKGGSSGNFKMIGSSSFSIDGIFLINPGDGGAGGSALAQGKNGAPNMKGGDATAIAGRGADNKKVMRVQGTVSGMSNVQVGDMLAGAGGWATAEPGNGGDADACGKNGGAGGKGSATGGRGGDAKLTLGGGAVRAELAKDIGGAGGGADSNGGMGGKGGSCGPDKAGGNGGNGGSAHTTEGKGGSGTNGNATDGANLAEDGGNGGNGGDGCGPGNGGTGGSGDPKGTDGTKGKNLCVEVKKETGVVPGGGGAGVTTGGTESTDGSGGGAGGGAGGTDSAKSSIKVIRYGAVYLPVEQLIIESEEGCDGGQPHWHALEGIVVATDGSHVIDPGPQCGFGKVADVPTMEYTPQ